MHIAAKDYADLFHALETHDGHFDTCPFVISYARQHGVFTDDIALEMFRRVLRMRDPTETAILRKSRDYIPPMPPFSLGDKVRLRVPTSVWSEVGVIVHVSPTLVRVRLPRDGSTRTAHPDEILAAGENSLTTPTGGGNVFPTPTQTRTPP